MTGVGLLFEFLADALVGKRFQGRNLWLEIDLVLGGDLRPDA